MMAATIQNKQAAYCKFIKQIDREETQLTILAKGAVIKSGLRTLPDIKRQQKKGLKGIKMKAMKVK